ncbi:Uncharacterised protein [Mycobacteroides abscessus]|nr:Uncharacterised protein [Mycobacteroides abscessus]CPR93667.1 Uncharacterised protein [Mycobacteroides abscessus]CPS58190.1 Uncharacterised protein [Mycobacteroides abscessus]CPU84351.1 Uncharacterised protein [Mycobacteroides abscessus]
MEHDKSCDGRCGWTRTFCEARWRADFLQLSAK